MKLEEEIKLIKATFNDEELLKAIRAIMFGLEVSDIDREKVQGLFKNEEVLKIFKKRFLPQVNKDADIGTVSDLWIGTEEMVFARDAETRQQAVGYKRIAIKRMEEAIKVLAEGGELEGVEYNPETDDDLNLGLLSRNLFIKATENNLIQLFVIAQQTKEEADKLIAERGLNSNK